MAIDHREVLRGIRTFPSLIKYLREELDWPIHSDDFDELTFDYEPEEIGIDGRNAAKIQEIKRLRPLAINQPWGIFFVKFEPKRLPVVVLRRLLSRVVMKKRASANSAERAAWEVGDLLFVSNYGEGNERQISFAHFFEDVTKVGPPTLKVLGWDNFDTPLHLDDVAEKLRDKLIWPADTGDIDRWRMTWRSAFTLRHREVITTSKMLAIRLAELASTIRDRIKGILAIETNSGPLTKMMTAFKEALIHDLDEDGFADMYAQTIAYGLLSVRVANPSGGNADSFAAAIPVTNPFLKELMKTFLNVGKSKGKARGGADLDFDELGVSEVVELLDAANMEAVVRDFGDRNPQEDPVIHFYELFLKEYDAKKRLQRGVFYTPRPVVSFIVRSIDELLRTEFGLQDGLADTTTWGEMTKHNNGLAIPEDTSPDRSFVQILDPATGTGTFLVEVIGLIYNTLTKKWTNEGHDADEIKSLWNNYVPEYLLPRLHGYEILMAPYAIAHLKIGLKLYETGYRFESSERARVYLTNSLEPPQDFSSTLAFAIPALAQEAEAVNAIKHDQRFTVVIGNPPYSYMSSNLSANAKAWVEPYRYVNGERIREKGAIVFERAIQDDYVKFISFAQTAIAASGLGLIGFISNAAYLDNPNMRGMRSSLMEVLTGLRLFHLHGDAKRDPTTDENVFDIQTGVAILLGSQSSVASLRHISIGNLIGSRSSKFRYLVKATVTDVDWSDLDPIPDQYRFVEERIADTAYPTWPSLPEVFTLTSVAIKTNRDHFVIDFDDSHLKMRIEEFINPETSDEEIREHLKIDSNAQWEIGKARRTCRSTYSESNYMALQYRPFDKRRIYYHTSVVFNDRPATMRPMLEGQNIALLSTRRIRTEVHSHFFVTDTICMAEMLSSADNCNIYPLFNFERDGLLAGTLHSTIRNEIVGLIRSPNPNAEPMPPRDLFNWIYAVVHSPSYRKRYQDQLKADHPRVPLPPQSTDFVARMCGLGQLLVDLHLVRSRSLSDHIATPVGSGDFQVEKVSYSNKTVWIDKAKTRGFRGVPEEVWNFHIGSYRVCEKWLKDRQAKVGKNPRPGRVLADEDIAHYQKIILALSETIHIMTKIDEIIDQYGGWPDAFQTEPQKDQTDVPDGEAAPFMKAAEDTPPYGSSRG